MLQLVRRQDWPERLALAIDEHMKGSFEWGQYDCGTLFSDVVFAMTGVDPIEDLGRWRCERSALRCLAKTGQENMKAVIDARFAQIPVLSAGRGDVGYCGEVSVLSCPAIVTGAEVVQRDEKGWMTLPLSALTTAYKVG